MTTKKQEALKEIDGMFQLVRLEFMRYNKEDLPKVEAKYKEMVKWLEEKLPNE